MGSKRRDQTPYERRDRKIRKRKFGMKVTGASVKLLAEIQRDKAKKEKSREKGKLS
jgi:hypothetical protein